MPSVCPPCRQTIVPAGWGAAARRRRCPVSSEHNEGTKPMSAESRITIDPNVCGGRPCIRGLRVRVTDVLSMLAAGASREEILEDYPYLEAADITAALDFAARQTDHPVLRVA